MRRVVFVALLALAGCGGSGGETTTGGTGGTGTLDDGGALLVLAGNAQTGVVGRQLPGSLTVQVVDSRNRPVKGQVVNFRVTAGGGSVFAGTGITNDSGVARELWTLGTTAAAQAVEARAVDAVTGKGLVFATFTATAVADSPASIAILEGNGQTAGAGTTLPVQVRVRVADRFGNGAGGVSVAFVPVVGEGQATPPAATTNATGEAAASWMLGPVVGQQSLEARVPGLTAAPFQANAAAPPSVLGVTMVDASFVESTPPNSATCTRPYPEPDQAWADATFPGLCNPANVNFGIPSVCPVACWPARTGPAYAPFFVGNVGGSYVTAGGGTYTYALPPDGKYRLTGVQSVDAVNYPGRQYSIIHVVFNRLLDPSTVQPNPLLPVAASNLKVYSTVASDPGVGADQTSSFDVSYVPNSDVSYLGAGIRVQRSGGLALPYDSKVTLLGVVRDQLDTPVAVDVTVVTAPAPAPAPVSTVSVSLGSSTIAVGQGTQASATLRDAGGTILGGRSITWSSSPTSVATVSASGAVTAVGPGTASIIATSEGRSGSATVTVAALPVSTVTVALTSPLGVGQTTQATAVARDANGAILPGKTFTWNSLTPSVATVSTSGLVTAVAAGSSTIQATSDGVNGTAPVTVLAAAGGPTQMVAVSATSQTGPPSLAATQAPVVLVTDASGAPVSGISVTFAVTSGGGTITGGSTTTDASGKARATTWTFGPAGVQSVRASSSAIPGVTVDFTALSRAATQAFDITLRFISTMSDSQARAFVHAKERIQEFIVGDLPVQNVSLSASQMASCGGVGVQQAVDDVLILAEVGPIDGVNNILGQAGPCYVRSPGTPWPVIGHMMFDSADLDALEAAGRLEYVILHEMMHVIGFGTIWTDMGLLMNPATSGGTDPTFSGTNATANLATYNNGAFYSGAKVPVEATGGAGTRDSHWRESVFNHELMTGFLDSGVNPISATTIGSFQDLGYGVDVTRADAFNLATALRIDWNSAVEPPLHLGRDVKPEPPGRIGPDGKPVR